MNEMNYPEIINHLNHNMIWVEIRIKLVLTSDEYIALLKGYQPHWDMRYGILYIQEEDYFYSYRSGCVVGKYKIEMLRDGNYTFTEVYENPSKNDCMVIFECVREAIQQNNLSFDRDRLMEMIRETMSLNETFERELPPDLGPQSPSDHPFTTKARKLQSLWRVQNGLDMGIGPNKNSVDKNTGMPTYYGNMIKDGETTGRNFFYPETFAYAQWRVTKKMKDETIDKYRLFNNLMSSMPMAFNLFHPLMMLHAQNPAVVDTMMQKVFPDLPIFKVKEIGLEFIPTPIERYTNDKSAMDVFVRFFDKNGGEYLIAIETKYTDSLGTNTTGSKEVYEKQIKLLRDLNLLSDEGIHRIESGEIRLSQIYRNFLLAEMYGRKQDVNDVYSVILAPNDHPSTQNEVNSLRNILKAEYHYKITAITLEYFLANIQSVAPEEQSPWLEWFCDRYLNFETSIR